MMLDFSKTILEKVSFDSYLFSKELRKLIIWFGENNDDLSVFKMWCYDKYGHVYPDLINQAFLKKDKDN